MQWHDWNPGWVWFGWLVMVLMMGLFWGLVIAVVVWAIRQFRPAPPPMPGRTAPGALGILEERFARGEIDEDEFRRRRSLLVPGGPAEGGATGPGATPAG